MRLKDILIVPAVFSTLLLGSFVTCPPMDSVRTDADKPDILSGGGSYSSHGSHSSHGSNADTSLLGKTSRFEDASFVFTDTSLFTDTTLMADTTLLIDTSLFTFKDTVMYVQYPLADTLLEGKNIFELLPGVELGQSLTVRTAMAQHVRLNHERKIPGYRIRIFFDNKQNARAESERIEKEFRFLFPEMQTYRSYANPYFKVTVGDFRTRSEAMSRLAKIKNIYPAAFLVKEDISYPPVDRNNPVYLDTVTLIIPKEEPSENVFF